MGARTGVGALGLVLLAILVFLAVSSWSRQPAVAKPSIQPITFPHSLHVQTYKMDCQYCHSDARRSEYAGLPSVARCMGCHKIAGAARPARARTAGRRRTSRWRAARARPSERSRTCLGPAARAPTSERSGPCLGLATLALTSGRSRTCLGLAPRALTSGRCRTCLGL